MYSFSAFRRPNFAFHQKIKAYGDPRLFALNLVSEHFSKSAQPLVPQRLFMVNGKDGAGEGGGMSGMLGQLLAMLLAEKAGVEVTDKEKPEELEEMAAQITRRFAQPELNSAEPTPAASTART